MRPWTFPANIWRTTSGTSARPTTCIVRASLFTSRSRAKRDHASSRASCGVFTEFDARQGDVAQDERQNRSGKIDTLSQAAGRHHAAILRLRQHVHQRMTADGVDSASPTLARDWRSRLRKRSSIDDISRAEAPQIIGFLKTSSRCNDAITEIGEEGDRDRADAAISAGYEDVATLRCDAAMFEGEHRQHRGVTGRADRHGVLCRKWRRDLHQPFAFQPCLLGISTVMGLA